MQLHQENAELKNKLVSMQEQTEVIKQAIRDRDEAIAKWEALFFPPDDNLNMNSVVSKV